MYLKRCSPNRIPRSIAVTRAKSYSTKCLSTSQNTGVVTTTLKRSFQRGYAAFARTNSYQLISLLRYQPWCFSSVYLWRLFDFYYILLWKLKRFCFLKLITLEIYRKRYYSPKDGFEHWLIQALFNNVSIGRTQIKHLGIHSGHQLHALVPVIATWGMTNRQT